MKIYKIQKAIAIAITSLAIFGIGSQVTRLVSGGQNSSFWIIVNTICVIYGTLSFMSDNQVIRYSQGFLFLIIASLIIQPSINAFAGIWLMICGLILLFKYSFFSSIKRVVPVLIFCMSMLTHAAIRNNQTSQLIGILPMILFSFVIFYLIFEEPHQQAIQKIRHLEPLSKIGRNGTAIVHSVKNKISNLETCTNFLRYDLLTKEEVIEKFDSSLADIKETINGLLAISNAGYDGAEEILTHNLSELLTGLSILLKQDRVLLQYADLNISIQPGVHASFNKFSFILAFENIIQNAVEALQQKGSRGQIDIILEHDSLEIRNNGGMIPTCISCAKDCNNCPLYKNIGRTDKPSGSGTGLPQVIDMVNQAGWSLKIRGYNGDMTSISFQTV